MNNNYNNINTNNTDSVSALSEYDVISEDRQLAEYVKDQMIYSGLFINPDEIYSKFPTNLSHRIRDPHVTVAYRPDVDKVFLDSLNSSADITVIGYGNNGENEGLLVKVKASDPIIQKTLDERVDPNRLGEIKPVRMHITTSIADGAEAVRTKELNFLPLENPVKLTGNFKIFRKDGVLISDKETIKEMKRSGFDAVEAEDPDRL